MNGCAMYHAGRRRETRPLFGSPGRPRSGQKVSVCADRRRFQQTSFIAESTARDVIEALRCRVAGWMSEKARARARMSERAWTMSTTSADGYSWFKCQHGGQHTNICSIYEERAARERKKGEDVVWLCCVGPDELEHVAVFRRRVARIDAQATRLWPTWLASYLRSASASRYTASCMRPLPQCVS